MRGLSEKNRFFLKAFFSFYCRHKTCVAVIIMIIVGFSIYANSIRGEFIWDDEALITGNLYVKSWHFLPQLFLQGTGEGTGLKGIFYRPLLMISLMLDYSLFKENVIGYHCITISLHILAAILFYLLCVMILNDKEWSLLASILFLIHPINVEDVAYITGRADSLVLIWMACTFILYLKLLQQKKIVLYFWMILSYVAALFSKENSVILPALLLVYHGAFRQKIRWNILLSLSGITAGYLLIRLSVLQSLLNHAPVITTPFQRLPGFFVALAQYMRLLVFPFDLHMAYGQRLFGWLDMRTIIGVVIFCFLVTFSCLFIRKRPVIFFSIGWFLISLIPVSNIFFPASSFMEERYLYIPALGLFVISAKLIVSLLRNQRLKKIGLGLALCIFFYFSLLTIQQNNYWRYALGFFERTLRYTNDMPEIYVSLGNVYSKRGNQEKAERNYRQALMINPTYAEAYYNLGVLYSKHDDNKALEFFEKTVALQNNHVCSLNNLASIYELQGKHDVAICYLKRAIELDPSYPASQFNLGVVYDTIGKTEEALYCYKRTIQINPFFYQAYTSLGILSAKRGKTDDALFFLKKAIEVNPHCVECFNNLAYEYSSLGNSKEALAHYRKALALDENNVDAHHGLGLEYLKAQSYKEAIEIYKKLLKRSPDDARGHNNIAIAYFYAHQYGLAAEHAKKAQGFGYPVNKEFIQLIQSSQNVSNQSFDTPG